jgi:hypothetical protein
LLIPQYPFGGVGNFAPCLGRYLITNEFRNLDTLAKDWRRFDAMVINGVASNLLDELAASHFESALPRRPVASIASASASKSSAHSRS